MENTSHGRHIFIKAFYVPVKPYLCIYVYDRSHNWLNRIRNPLFQISALNDRIFQVDEAVSKDRLSQTLTKKSTQSS